MSLGLTVMKECLITSEVIDNELIIDRGFYSQGSLVITLFRRWFKDGGPFLNISETTYQFFQFLHELLTVINRKNHILGALLRIISNILGSSHYLTYAYH